MLRKMPHLQDAMVNQERLERTGVGSTNGMDSSPSRPEELLIKVAKPNFLASSDPVVAMAKKVSAAVVESSFESVENESSHTLSSPPPRRIINNVISPTSSIGQIISTSPSSATAEISSSESESTSSLTPVTTTVHGSVRISHSPILVKRRVSRSEDDEVSSMSKRLIKESTVLKYSESPSTSEPGRPTLIRRGSSLVLGKRTPEKDEPKHSTGKKLKSEDARNVVGEATSTAEIEAAAVSTMAGMRNEKPPASPPPTEEKGEDSSNGARQKLPLSHPPHTVLHQGFLPGAVVQPVFHHHLAAFGAHPFGPNGAYPMLYSGYPPHVPPGAVPPMMVGQFHAHPAQGFYPYHPSFHPHAMAQHGGQHLPPFVTPHGQMPAGPKAPVSKAKSKTDSGSIKIVKSKSSKKSADDGEPVSINRCVPLQDPIPSKQWGNAESTKNVVLPDFHRLVNYPAYLNKSRSLASGDASGGSKAVAGKKHCVMCGKLRICSASSLMEKGRAGMSSDDGTAHIIPRQNKGLCTACDITVWVLVAEGLEIKWCKGCKNFRQWSAFGQKGSATKCVRCRERQREKYAMQKDAKRGRRNTKASAPTEKSPQENLPSAAPSSSTKNQHIGSVEKKEEMHFAAARGLTSLMNAAASL